MNINIIITENIKLYPIRGTNLKILSNKIKNSMPMVSYTKLDCFFPNAQFYYRKIGSSI